MLPETLQLRRRGQVGVAEEVPFPATRQRGSARITARHAISDLFYSFGNQHPGALVLNNFPRFMQELSIPGNPFFDMGTVDIVRARERGVPRYNEFRRQLGLNPIQRFEDLTDDAEIVRELKSVYGARQGGRRETRPADRHARRRPPAHRLRFRRDDVPDLHPERQPSAAG